MWRPDRILEGDDRVERAFLPSGATEGETDADASQQEQSEEPDQDAEAVRLEQALVEARASGYEEGRARAAAEWQSRLDSFQEQVAESLKRLANLERTLFHDYEARLLEVAVEAASRIVRVQLETDDGVAGRVLLDTLENLPTRGNLCVRLHPDDVDAVSRLLGSDVDSGRIGVAAEPSLSRGDVLVESDGGKIDARIETAEAAVRTAVLGTEETP